ncbi:hypothetical protein BH18ACT1_BH18ACT1_13210 [soil metagenome]
MPWALVALVLVPLVASAIGLLATVGGDYHPRGDIAGIELHTRDVGRHPVLMGLYSREGWNHPGPMLFYVLAVPYRLLGELSASLHVGALLVNGVAVAGMALVARRRGGTPLFLLTLVGSAVVISSFGPELLRDPWNVSITVFPFGLLVFLVWELTCGRARSLPAAAVVTTFCVQTHVGYAVLALPLLLWGVAWLVVPAWRGRRSREASGEVAGTWSDLRRPALLALALVVALWLPPVGEHFGGRDGNLGRIVDYLTAEHDEEDGHTLGDGVRLVSSKFGLSPEWVTGEKELTTFTAEPVSLTSAPVPVFLGAYAVALVVLWRRGSRSARRLAMTVTFTLALGVIWVSRIIGPVFDYRLGWLSVLAMIAFVVIAWAAWLLVAERTGPGLARGVGLAAVVPLFVLGAASADDGARAGTPANWGSSSQVESMAEEILAKLPDRDGDIIIDCSDEGCIPHAGLVLLLERAGEPVRVSRWGGLVSADADHRVHERDAPRRARLHVEVNSAFKRFDRAADRPGAGLLSYRGELPLDERNRLVAEVRELDRDLRAGRIDEVDHFARRSKIGQQLSTRAVAVYQDEPERR